MFLLLLAAATLGAPAAPEGPGKPAFDPATAGPPTLGFLSVPLPEDVRQKLKVPLPRGGLLVLHVYGGGPAKRAGVRTGDVVMSVEGRPVTGVAHAAIDRLLRVGREVRLEVWRDGKSRKLGVTAAGSYLVLSVACDEREPLGCTQLGALLWRGQGVHQDGGRAVALFQKACAAKEALGCTLLAGLYVVGEGVPRDAGRAAALLDESCAAGERAGCAALGRLYLSGQGVMRDPVYAVGPSLPAGRGGREG